MPMMKAPIAATTMRCIARDVVEADAAGERVEADAEGERVEADAEGVGGV